MVAPPGPAVLPLHPPHQGAALTLTPLGIEPETLTLQQQLGDESIYNLSNHLISCAAFKGVFRALEIIVVNVNGLVKLQLVKGKV